MHKLQRGLLKRASKYLATHKSKLKRINAKNIHGKYLHQIAAGDSILLKQRE